MNDKWRIVRDGVFDEQFLDKMLRCARFESPRIDMLNRIELLSFAFCPFSSSTSMNAALNKNGKNKICRACMWNVLF